MSVAPTSLRTKVYPSRVSNCVMKTAAGDRVRRPLAIFVRLFRRPRLRIFEYSLAAPVKHGRSERHLDFRQPTAIGGKTDIVTSMCKSRISLRRLKLDQHDSETAWPKSDSPATRTASTAVYKNSIILPVAPKRGTFALFFGMPSNTSMASLVKKTHR